MDGYVNPAEFDDSGKTKSQKSLERAKTEATGKAQARTIADTLKQNLAKWDGSVLGEGGDVEDAAGLAAGGPLYAAVKEVAGVLESKDEDSDSLVGALRKTIEDKTGITAVKEKTESVKDGLKDRIRGWAGRQETAEADEKKGKRDKKGRFIRPVPSADEKEQVELSAQTFDLAQRESKESKKRHQELIRAVRSIDGGGGLLDNMLDGWGNRGGRGRDGKKGSRANKGRSGSRDRDRSGRLRETGGRGGTGGRTAGRGGGAGGRTAGRGGGAGGRTAGRGGGRIARLGARLGGFGSRALGVGAGLLGAGSLLGGTEAAASAATSRQAASTAGSTAGTTAGTTGATRRAGASASTRAPVAAEAAGRRTGLLGKASSLAGKGLAGAAKAIPIAGQILAAGMAVYDGVQGWNDNELHQDAFGLAEGEEASTGQKASAATASVLDMGGLFTGLAGLAGFEIDTADIASGIYTAGTAVSNTVVEAWDAAGGSISTASAAAGIAIAQAWDTASTGISEAASGAWDAISGAATTAWDKTSTAVAEAATGAWDSVTEGTAKAWDTASSAASSAIAATGEVVSSAWDSTSSAVGGAVTDAWDSVAGGASSAWAGVTGFFSGDKPEAKAPEQAENSTVAVQATAVQPETTLLGARKAEAAQSSQTSTKNEKDKDELGMDAVVVPDDKMTGMFDTLTTAVTELGDTIKDEIKRKELESGGAFSAVSGLVSGVSTWVTDRLASTGRGGGGGGGGGGR